MRNNGTNLFLPHYKVVGLTTFIIVDYGMTDDTNNVDDGILIDNYANTIAITCSGNTAVFSGESANRIRKINTGKTCPRGNESKALRKYS